jgi:hypothetical protein
LGLNRQESRICVSEC